MKKIGQLHFMDSDGFFKFGPIPGKGANNLISGAIGIGQNLLNGVGSSLLNGTNGGAVAEFQTLLNKQMEVQAEMQAVSMESNVSRADHETKMTPIRNIRLN